MDIPSWPLDVLQERPQFVIIGLLPVDLRL